MSQILVRLVGNAVRFTERGRVIVQVDYLDDALQICVADTGPGMSPTVVERVQAAFEQADNSDQRHHGGLGLGLTVVAALTRAMGGQLTIRSSPEHGTKVEVSLPGTEVEAEPRPQLGHTAVLLHADPLPGRTLKLDMGRLGCRVVVCPTEREALRALQEHDARLLFVPMDFGDGKAASRLQRLHPCRAILLHDRATEAPLGQESLMWPAALADLERLLSPGEAETLHEGVALRILLVDDQPAALRLGRMQLEMLGCEVETALDGYSAVAWVAERDFDLVFTDLQMPGIDGIETTRRMHAHRPDLPVIALTAAASTEDRERCLAGGMRLVITKPYSKAQMQEALRHARPFERVITRVFGR